jgi:hypothetical protein
LILQPTSPGWLFSHPVLSFFLERDLFGKPVPTFPDHAQVICPPTTPTLPV